MSRTAVISVNYKGLANTVKCLHAVYRSRSIPKVVLVDNTPNDPGLDTAVAAFPGSVLLRSDQNLGYGSGNNIGIDWALQNTTCEFILLLNNDAWIDPDTIESLEHELDTDATAGMVTPKVVFAEDPAKLWYGSGFVEWRFARGNVPGFQGRSDTELSNRRAYVSFASGCVLMIRRSVLEAIGGFNSSYFMYEEDTEFSVRSNRAGFKILYAPDVIVSHLVQGSLREEGDAWVDPLSSKNDNLAFYVSTVIKNRLFTLRLHANTRQKALFAFWFPIYLGRLALTYTLVGRFDGVLALARATLLGLTQPCGAPVAMPRRKPD
ncbi:MAG: glycosyltransferase family 2 protein [Burkholderiaceae bacterium]